MAPPHVCTQTESIDKINKRVVNQKILGEETFAKIQDVEEALENHRTHQRKYEADLAVFIADVTGMMNTVNAKIIPAYEREVNADNARAWIKDQAKSGSFWIGVAMSILGLFWAIIELFSRYVRR